ncbi:MAG: hypothetical protein WCT08_03365 [Patescibacteria group bacterium]|jgi:hypothetical protein
MDNPPQNQANPEVKETKKPLWFKIIITFVIILIAAIIFYVFVYFTQGNITFSRLAAPIIGISQLECKLNKGIHYVNLNGVQNICLKKSVNAGKVCTHDRDCQGGGCMPSATRSNETGPFSNWQGTPKFNDKGELTGICSDLDYSDWPTKDADKINSGGCNFPIGTIDNQTYGDSGCLIF